MGNKTDAERAEMYRRQLGGAEKALRRERQKVRDLESLVRDAERLLTAWDKADWDCMPEEDKIGDYEPEGNLRVLQQRMAELGLEAER